MNESLSRTYTIVINNKLYKFSSTDGTEHVEKLKIKLEKAFNVLSAIDSGQVLSNFAVKLVLLLADDIVKEETGRLNLEKQVNYKLTNMIAELDKEIFNNN